MEEGENLPENDIPKMQDLIQRRIRIKDILYENLLCLYLAMPKKVRELVKKLVKAWKGKNQ